MVTLPRWALVALACALGGSLLLVAYLLGRESARPEPVLTVARPTRPVPPPTATAAPPVAESPAPAVDAFAAPPSESPTWPAAPRQLAPATPSGGEPAPVPTRPGPATSEVEAYFARLEQVQLNDVSTSPEAAQQMLSAMTGGDTSQFDRLLAEAERAEREVRSISPPERCRAYHAALLELLHDSTLMLGDLKKAIGAEDSNQLLALGAKAADLQRRGDALKEQEKALRNQ
jgi:hypothetical protein